MKLNHVAASRTTVFLNGCKQRDVVAADDDEGWVDRYVYRNGEYVQEAGGSLKIERVRGWVRFEFAAKEPNW